MTKHRDTRSPGIDPEAPTRVGENVESRPDEDELVGTEIGGCTILHRIAKGGMGTVYKAKQVALDRIVAVKVINPEFASDPLFRERFRRESTSIASLAHPNIVTVFDAGEENNTPYLVMEYVACTSLRDLMSSRIEEDRALKITSQILAALDHAHKADVVHRDIKPENVLIDAEGNAKVADFGLVRLLGKKGTTTLTQTRLVMGTYEYMAPEQRLDSENTDGRSDIYAVGVMLYEMLTGKLPIGNFDPPSTICEEIKSGRTDRLVDKALATDPDWRFQSAGNMNDAVGAVISGRPFSRFPLRRGEFIALGSFGIALLIALIIALVTLNSSEESPAAVASKTAAVIDAEQQPDEVDTKQPGAVSESEPKIEIEKEAPVGESKVEVKPQPVETTPAPIAKPEEPKLLQGETGRFESGKAVLEIFRNVRSRDEPPNLPDQRRLWSQGISLPKKEKRETQKFLREIGVRTEPAVLQWVFYFEAKSDGPYVFSVAEQRSRTQLFIGGRTIWHDRRRSGAIHLKAGYHLVKFRARATLGTCVFSNLNVLSPGEFTSTPITPDMFYLKIEDEKVKNEHGSDTDWAELMAKILAAQEKDD